MASSTSTAILFDDMFEVNAVDNKKFDKVSRIDCRGESYDMELQLDINTDIYPIKTRDRFGLALATTLSLDQHPDEGIYDPTLSKRNTLLNQYEYAMYGKVFKFEEVDRSLAVYASFGGLLMKLQGSTLAIQRLELDMNIYLLIRKV
mmetsp:Transcript_19175/g.28538  ORF Transcript_19175/g.28538 Transcript_19175/m.28538 type:complete len:147 (-) Transcript_19175:44-484(-)